MVEIFKKKEEKKHEHWLSGKAWIKKLKFWRPRQSPKEFPASALSPLNFLRVIPALLGRIQIVLFKSMNVIKKIWRQKDDLKFRAKLYSL